MATSVLTPVVWSDPWLKIVSIEETCIPSPICFGLTPPTRSFGREAPCMFWLIMSWKLTRPFLNPVVLTFEMLLPITSMRIWWFCRPLTPA